MGGNKQFHPWTSSEGEKPLVAASFDAIASACRDMVVVLGHRAEEVSAALKPREFHPCMGDPDAPMFASVQAGVQMALVVRPESSILLHPADHPEVAPATLESLQKLAFEFPNLVLIPEYEGRGGHPTLIPHSIARRLLATECPQGLGKFWTTHPELCLRVSVDDARVVQDVDSAS